MKVACLLACAVLMGLLVRAKGDEVQKEFTVDAKKHVTRSPLKTGMIVKPGDTLTFTPNPDDRWTQKGSEPLDYRGRESYPTMKLSMKLGDFRRSIEDGMTV